MKEWSVKIEGQGCFGSGIFDEWTNESEPNVRHEFRI